MDGQAFIRKEAAEGADQVATVENIPFQPIDQGIRSRIQGGCQDDTVFLAENVCIF